MNATDLAAEHAPTPTTDRSATRRRRLVVGAATLLVTTALSATVTPGVVSAQSAPARACSNGAYSVARGDGWSLIARKLGTSTRALLAANGASTRTVLHPGQSICAPVGATGATTSAQPATLTGSTKPSGSAAGAATASCAGGTYTVVRGDGWLAIAKKLGVTSKTLLAANSATTSTVLHPGRTICVPAGAQAPASTPAPSAPAAPPVKNLTAAENEAIIRAAWPDELEEEALRIARRESNLRNNAKNWCCYGLFQIHWNAHKSWLAGIGVTKPEQLFDPTVNANAAYALYQRAGSFRPWAL
jgi:LysM repeat protein